MIWRSVCAVCGDPVTGGGDGGASPDVPAGGQVAVCLTCLCLRVEDDDEVQQEKLLPGEPGLAETQDVPRLPG